VNTATVNTEKAREVRESLILEHLPQVRLIARRIHERLPESVSLDDLVSSGILGLIAAIDNFDAAQNVKLRTYAEYKIRGAILDSLRKLDWASRDRRRKTKQIEAAILEAEQRLHRAAVEEEIAAELHLDLEEYREWQLDILGINLNSLDYNSDREDGRNLIDTVADTPEHWPSNLLESSELDGLLASAMERMPPVERTVLCRYYQEELTLREIAQIMNLHLSRICQLKSRAILRLRCFLKERWPTQRGR
jgi:RNA polymerase sigma factor, FliA/WhiG family/RNA polymerase sigma factor, sigma-70 family